MLITTAAIIYVPGAYRMARALAVNINALDYVIVARTRGEGKGYVMLREILPNIAGPMLADLGLRFVYVVLLLASLSFLGLGVQPPAADWDRWCARTSVRLPTPACQSLRRRQRLRA